MKTNLDNTNFKHDNNVLDGEALKMRETRLNKELKAGTITPDGEKELEEIRKKLQHARNIINNGKEITQDTDYRNTFRDEESVMKVNTPKVSKKSNHSGGVNSQILSNEKAMNEEISSIRYLIEYMNNNNKKQKI